MWIGEFEKELGLTGSEDEVFMMGFLFLQEGTPRGQFALRKGLMKGQSAGTREWVSTRYQFYRG